MTAIRQKAEYNNQYRLGKYADNYNYKMVVNHKEVTVHVAQSAELNFENRGMGLYGIVTGLLPYGWVIGNIAVIHDPNLDFERAINSVGGNIPGIIGAAISADNLWTDFNRYKPGDVRVEIIIESNLSDLIYYSNYWTTEEFIKMQRWTMPNR
jgi:hypothetical protein